MSTSSTAWMRNWRKNCPEEARIRNLIWRRNNRKKDLRNRLRSRLKRLYNLSLEWYSHKLKEQNGVCAIHNGPETATRLGKIKDLAVDHNHVTGHPRGLLCQKCNIGLGHFNDDPLLLRKAADYLDAHSQQV